MEKRCSFELFKSNVCHWLKEEGDIDFLIQVLESDLIRKYYNNLELIYWTNNGGVKLPLEDWQYKVIAQVLGLSIQEDKNGNITFSHFPKDFVMKRVEKMGILIPVDGERKQK